MKVLGISPLDKDSTVTVVEDGVITYAAAEERFTRVKLQDGFPWQALDAALAATGTSMAEIDRVTYPFLSGDEEIRLFEKNIANEKAFLDEATASLDEPSEAALYKLLQERLPGLTIMSIGHRSTLLAFHKRQMTLERDGQRYRLRSA